MKVTFSLPLFRVFSSLSARNMYILSHKIGKCFYSKKLAGKKLPRKLLDLIVHGLYLLMTTFFQSSVYTNVCKAVYTSIRKLYLNWNSNKLVFSSEITYCKL